MKRLIVLIIGFILLTQPMPIMAQALNSKTYTLTDNLNWKKAQAAATTVTET